MHPFGGTPICPRCSKAVYLAEQVMGPGRKLYHKPCLACTSCNKRLDSFTLLEHDQLPYCKACHLKNFGTRDLRHANLPNAPPPGENTTLPSPPSSPARGASFPPQALLRPMSTGTTSSSSNNGTSSPIPRLRPNRTLATSPISPSFPRGSSPNSSAFQTNGNGVGEAKSETSTATYTSSPVEEEKAGRQESSPALATSSIAEEAETEEEAAEARDTISEPASSNNFSTTSYPSHTGRPGIGTIPRTIPLYLNGTNGGGMYKHHTSQSLGSITVPSTTTNSSSPSSSSPTSASFNRSKEAEDAVDDHISRSFPGPGSPMGMGMGSVRSASPARLSPLTQTATGTRYGIALAGGVNVHSTGAGGSPRKWGGGTPTCPKCNKSVYFAEQVKAVGKTFHKNCLRCTECNTSLDSTRLRDHDGDPYCAKCYGKLYGPAGSGYALLGKAGG